MTTRLLFLFDLDGTLIDSRRDLARATNRMRQRHDLEPLSLDVVVSYVGDGIGKLASRAVAGTGVDPEAARREVEAEYAAHLWDETRPYPGVEEGFRTLKTAGHTLGLVTNKPAPHTRRLFDHFGWTDLFAVRMAGGNTPELKPSPLPVLEAMNRTGFPPEQTWMVGDHHTDLEAARRAGIRSIFLQSGLGHTGQETPTRTCANFAEFVSLFTV